MIEIKGEALVIVAHPDDETIWMGGTILGNKKCAWTILSLSRGDDKDRAPKFQKVCRCYDARGIISDLEDEGKMNIRDSIPEIRKRVKTFINKRFFDYIFTHSLEGEYGHPRHKGVNRAVRSLLKESILNTKNVLFFDYPLNERRGYSVPGKNAEVKFALPLNIFKKKRSLIHDVYGFSKDSFEFKSASRVEAFNLN